MFAICFFLILWLLAVPPSVLDLLLSLKHALELFVCLRLQNWNSLPLHIHSSDILATFISRLKSHFFSSAYSHSYASASDSTCGYWRCINI